MSMKAPFTESTSPEPSSGSSGAVYWASRGLEPNLRAIPVKCATAASGVGNDRFAAWSKLPSRSTSRHPAAATRGRSWITSTIRSRAPSVSTVSGFSSRASGADVLTSQWLFA